MRAAASSCQRASRTSAPTTRSKTSSPAGAYAYLHTNPYHLVAGSYLAAVGCVGGAALLLRAMSAELEMADGVAEGVAEVRPP